MTKEDILEHFEDTLRYFEDRDFLDNGCSMYDKLSNMLDELEQELKTDILDKITDEISSLTLTEASEDCIRTMAELYSFKITTLMIIAKYR